MTETTSVVINGDREHFVSKMAVNRLKRDLRALQEEGTIDPTKYLKAGYIFDIKKEENNYQVHIIDEAERSKELRKKMLRERLRNAKDNRSGKTKQKLNSLKRCIPKKIFQSYQNLVKQFNFNIPSPDEVINDPSKFTSQISAITGNMGRVSNDDRANIAIKKYFNSLGDFLGIEPMNINLRQDNTQTQLSNIELSNQDADTEDEDEN